MAWVSTMNPAHGSSPQGYLQDLQTHKRFIIIIQFSNLKFNTSSQSKYTPCCMLHCVVLYKLLLAVNMSLSLSLVIPAVSLPLVLSKHCQLSPPGHHSYVGGAGDDIPVSPVLFILISALYCPRNF